MGRPAGRSYGSGRDALVGVVLPVALWLLRLTPRAAFPAIERLLAALYLLLLRRDRAIVLANLERVLGLPHGSAELRRTARRVVRNQIALLLETVRGIVDPGAVAIAGVDALEQALPRLLGSGRGFLLVTGHLGSWELLAAVVARATGRRFHVLAKRSRIAPITTLIEALRGRSGAHILWVDDTSLVRDMLAVLRRGDALGFAMDQKPRAYQGPVVDFLGYPTEMPAGPAAIAERTRCAVIAAFCVRTAPFRYRLEMEELLPPDHDWGGSGRGEEELTQIFAHAIDRHIRRHPDQWTWSYRRWLFEGRSIYRPGRAERRRPST